MYFDTHAHLNFNAYKDDSLKIIKNCLRDGFSILNVGSQYSTSRRAVSMAKQYDSGIYAAIGLHPVQLNRRVTSLYDEWELGKKDSIEEENYKFEKYWELAKDKKTLAIGEVGLDYHHFESSDNIEKLKNKQKEVLLEFMGMANQVNKPLVLHCWDAYDELLEILEKNPVKKTGIAHSFVGSHRTAKKFINLGYLIGLNGIITYGQSYDKLIKETPLEKIVLETDCPYLAPVPLKGARNEPHNLFYVAQKISKIKGFALEKVIAVTTLNARKILLLE